jgi:uncharacterized membrane protein YebE (DUF533 family)
MASGVKFIRVKGRVVPIRDNGKAGQKKRKDGGRDLRSAPGHNMKDVHEIFDKHGRAPTTKERVKSAAMFSVVAGGALGFGATMASVLINRRSATKALVGGAAAGTALAAYGAYSSNAKVMSNRKWNKELGKRKAKGTTGF